MIYYHQKRIIGLYVKEMKRDELKSQIDDLMSQYANGEIDGITYSQKMMELTTSAQNNDDDNGKDA